VPPQSTWAPVHLQVPWQVLPPVQVDWQVPLTQSSHALHEAHAPFWHVWHWLASHVDWQLPLTQL